MTRAVKVFSLEMGASFRAACRSNLFEEKEGLLGCRALTYVERTELFEHRVATRCQIFVGLRHRRQWMALLADAGDGEAEDALGLELNSFTAIIIRGGVGDDCVEDAVVKSKLTRRLLLTFRSSYNHWCFLVVGLARYMCERCWIIVIHIASLSKPSSDVQDHEL